MMNPIEGFRDPPHSALRFNSIGSLAMLAAIAAQTSTQALAISVHLGEREAAFFASSAGLMLCVHLVSACSHPFPRRSRHLTKTFMQPSLVLFLKAR
jgi:hypothetical protein